MENDILNYIPHRGSMALIDEIIDRDKENFIVGVTINAKSLLVSEQGVPTYCGIEYMAQSTAAFSTIHSSKDNKSKVGFMVSVRNFQSSLDYYPLESKLHVFVEPISLDTSSGTFNCRVTNKGDEVSSAKITIYIPDEKELEKLKV